MDMDALDTFFYLMAERHRIYRKRTAGLPFPWTTDPVLLDNRFCNVYRILDRGTQYVVNEIINKGPQDHRETCFRVMLYKLFNRIPTWEYIVQKLGTPTWETFDINKYGRVLRARLLSSPIYTSAYQIPAPKLGYPTSHMNHLRQLQMMMDDDVPTLLLRKTCLKDAFKLIESYPGMGPFLGLQLLLDLNMTSQLDFSESEWVTCGPGSRNYLRQIFGNTVSGIENEAIAYLHITQNDHFERMGITDPPSLSPDRPGVSYVDIEHSLCECHKYVRLRKRLGSGVKSKKEEFKPTVKDEAKVKVDDETKLDVKKDEDDVKETNVKKETSSDRRTKLRAKNIIMPSEREIIVISDSEDEPQPEREVIIISDSDALSELSDLSDLEEASDPRIPSFSNPGQALVVNDDGDGDDGEGADPGRYVDDDTDYEVSRIVADRRTSTGEWEYKVRWTGYGPEDDMWLPEQELQNAPMILREWRALRRTKLRRNMKMKMADGVSRNTSGLRSRIKNFSI